jgi:hypothetical protein
MDPDKHLARMTAAWASPRTAGRLPILGKPSEKQAVRADKSLTKGTAAKMQQLRTMQEKVSRS